MFNCDINTKEGRKIFIVNYPSGYYSGADVQRNEFVIELTRGVGMVKTIMNPMGEDFVIRYDINGEEIVA